MPFEGESRRCAGLDLWPKARPMHVGWEMSPPCYQPAEPCHELHHQRHNEIDSLPAFGWHDPSGSKIF